MYHTIRRIKSSFKCIGWVALAPMTVQPCYTREDAGCPQACPQATCLSANRPSCMSFCVFEGTRPQPPLRVFYVIRANTTTINTTVVCSRGGMIQRSRHGSYRLFLNGRLSTQGMTAIILAFTLHPSRFANQAKRRRRPFCWCRRYLCESLLRNT